MDNFKAAAEDTELVMHMTNCMKEIVNLFNVASTVDRHRIKYEDVRRKLHQYIIDVLEEDGDVLPQFVLFRGRLSHMVQMGYMPTSYLTRTTLCAPVIAAIKAASVPVYMFLSSVWLIVDHNNVPDDQKDVPIRERNDRMDCVVVRIAAADGKSELVCFQVFRGESNQLVHVKELNMQKLLGRGALTDTTNPLMADLYRVYDRAMERSRAAGITPLPN